MSNEMIKIDNTPAIPGLAFRHFRGPADFPHMVAVVTASVEADQIEHVGSVESVANTYANLSNCDPYQDMIVAEVNGEVIGYSRGEWYEEVDPSSYQYVFSGFLVPAWRRKGIGRVMLHWMEGRLREIAAEHPPEQLKFFTAFVAQHGIGRATMLEREGYRPVRYFYEMVRPTMDDIPNFPMPEGLEFRPVLPEQYRAIWETSNEALRDHWGFAEPSEENYQEWLGNKTIFQPQLWQIAWDKETDQIAGQVRTFIDHAQNEKYNRKRGYTEFITVRRPWRRRGLARALIALSLHAQKEQGMTESALGVDSENPSGALRIYEDCGFHVVKQTTVYRKPL